MKVRSAITTSLAERGPASARDMAHRLGISPNHAFVACNHLFGLARIDRRKSPTGRHEYIYFAFEVEAAQRLREPDSVIHRARARRVVARRCAKSSGNQHVDC